MLEDKDPKGLAARDEDGRILSRNELLNQENKGNTFEMKKDLLKTSILNLAKIKEAINEAEKATEVGVEDGHKEALTLDEVTVENVEFIGEDQHITESPVFPYKEDELNEAERVPKVKLDKKRVTYGVGILLGIYLLGVAFYNSRYLPNTVVNDVELGNSTPVIGDIAFHDKYSKEYKVVEDGKEVLTYTLSDVGVDMSFSEELRELLADQDKWLWPLELAKEKESTIEYTYDAEKLNTFIAEHFTNDGRTLSVDASIDTSDNKLAITKEVYGNTWDYVELGERLTNPNETKVDVTGAYVLPTVTSSDEQFKGIMDQADKLVNTKITYDLAGAEEQVSIGYDWLTYTDGVVGLNDEVLRDYLVDLSGRHETMFSARDFVTISGETVSVPAGSYGWYIDVKTEVNQLRESILAGETKTLTPAIIGSGFKEGDIGTRYIEVSLSAQHMWFIEDGNILLETDIVSGKESSPTPRGVDYVWSKERYKTLVGPNGDGTSYASEVDYWMAINWTGVGIHDSYWQSAYGGERYLTNGSHGCLNTPLDMVDDFYNLAEIGTPVIVY